MPAWEVGDEDMKYGRYDHAREKYLSGIDDTDVNVKMKYLSGLLFWELWQSNNDTADSLFVIGDLLYPELSDEDAINRYINVQVKSLQYRGKYNAALAKSYELKKRLEGRLTSKETVANLLSIAAIYEKISRPDSLEYYAELALDQARLVMDSMDLTMSAIYRTAAIASMRIDDYEVSEARFNKALFIAEAALGKRSDPYAKAYGNLPVLYSSRGDYPKAIEVGIKAADLSKSIGNKEGQGIFITNVGIEYYYLGDFGKAIYYLQQGKDIKVDLYGVDDHRVSGANRILGILYEASGDYQLASEYYQSVLKSYNTSKDVPSYRIVEINGSLANFNTKLGNYEQAKLHSSKAIALIKSEQGEDNHDLYYNYLDMSTIMSNMQDADQSLHYAMLATEIENKHHGDHTLEYALSNSSVATANAYLMNMDQAIRDIDKSLDIIEDDNGDMTMSTSGIYILDNRARIFNLQAKREPTQEHITAYVKEVERLIRYTHDFRTNFSDAFSKSGHLVLANKIYKMVIEDIYDLYEVEKDERLIELSLDLMEGSKAAVLKDVINENVVKFSALPDSLKNQEEELKDAYISLNHSYNEDLQNDSLSEAVQVARLLYNSFIEEHVLKDPKYFAMRADSTKLSLDEIRSNLGEGEVTVEYFKEFSNYYALTISKDQTGFYKLGATAHVDSLVDVWQRLMINRDKDINEVSETLHQIIWYPLQLSEDVERVIIVPSGTLWLLSFEALHDGDSYLIADYNIQYSLSLEVDKFVQRFKKGNLESLAIFAPGWEDDLKNRYKAQVSDTSLLDREYLGILRQPWSLQLSKYLEDNFDIVSYDQEEATESNFKSSLGRTSILHFASHAVVNNDDPLRSKVHLAKDGDGVSGDDGYLHAYEIFDMSLNADLAVLGACETGVGQMKEGEGMLSLSYAMQYAGCASTIMSLWKIDESSSTAIFSKFYKGLSEELNISDALHASKLEFLKDEQNINLQHPYYWAGTVFMGLDHVVPLQPKSLNYLLWAIVGMVLIAAVTLVSKRLS